MNRLRELRQRKKLTLDELANNLEEKTSLKLSSNALGKYERGERKPSEKVLASVANEFKVPISYLRGEGWSQDDVIYFLIYVYANKYNDWLELPSGIHCEYGNIKKYGMEKESLIDFDAEDIPGFKEKVKDFLNDMPDGEDEKEDYISSDELEDIKNDAIQELDNKSINLPMVLDKLISKNLLETLNVMSIENEMSLEQSETSEYSIEIMKSNIDKNLFDEFKVEALAKIKSVNDYVFLSSIGESFNSTGVSPEYEIAKRVADDLELKNFENRQDYFSQDPYRASSDAVNSLSIPTRDKSHLLDIIDYLISENEKTNERIKELNKKIAQLENH